MELGHLQWQSTLAEHGIFTCLVKTYSAEALIEFFNNSTTRNHVAMSIGIGEHDLDKFKTVYAAVGS